MTWRAIARSSIGTSHKKHQLPCQDYGKYIISKQNLILGAVADGAGSAKHSDVGAKLAVETALQNLYWFHRLSGHWQSDSKPLCEAIARELFTHTLEKVVEALREQAENSGYLIDDLACTLLIFVANPYWIAATQIGDGFIVVRFQEEDHQLLFPPYKGEFINETTFVTSANALKEMQVCVRPGQQKFICASTDGLERVAIRMSDWTPFTPFFQPLEECLWEDTRRDGKEEYIRNFLDSDRLNARTDDDKTLLLCLYNKEQ